MNPNLKFHPFYDPDLGGRQLGVASKVTIALLIGGAYNLLAWWGMSDKQAYFQHSTWILGVISSTALLGLYIASDIFRRNLAIFARLERDSGVTQRIVSTWLSNKAHLAIGTLWALLGIAMATGLGIPAELTSTPLSQFLLLLGYFLAGFSSGMGALAIVAIIALYLRFAPMLQYSLDETDPDGIGGIKSLGDSLWFFCLLTTLMGVLIASYMFGVQWLYIAEPLAQGAFVLWVSTPFVFAVSIVLIPGLAVRRQVSRFKDYRELQLKQRKAELYSSYKKFESVDDDAIIEKKREIAEQLNVVQERMDKLRGMRESHLDSSR